MLPARLILIRGLPGSGKSTLAKVFSKIGFDHVEADQWMYNEYGVYQFQRNKLEFCHDQCLLYTKLIVHTSLKCAVVSNTFSRLWEMQPYLDLDVPTQVIECQGKYQSIHDVPPQVIISMRNNWERYN